ncbi:MAG TPA: tetratricopeptide repeat protein, partial [Anaerolineales bacterium]|nr:tetratricopeptide repeat protein [Anaerolineales bacterium]
MGNSFVLAGAPRSVAVSGSAQDLIIVTGDGNHISLARQGTFAFHLLDEAFRRAQHTRTPAAFYDGARPNWANIALKQDAHRRLYAEVWAFATGSDLPGQRMGLILGLAGEGKTTLLMRLAWGLAEAGYPVLWRHGGTLLPHCRIPLDGQKPLILCFDSLDQEPENELISLLTDLHDIGLPFVLLGTARRHEWRHAGIEGALRRLARFRAFHLGPLDPGEAKAILARLEEAGKLDALAPLSPAQRLKHFLDRKKADGQLLPALLTARSGAADFEYFVLDVLEKVWKWPHGEFLLRGHAFISAVHRFGFWLGRNLLARVLNLPEAEVAPRLLRPLEGELLEVTEAERRLYTRHPVIAEVAFRLATEELPLPEAEYLYEALFRALGALLQEHPEDPQRKLLTLLPLALQRRRLYEQARRLFDLATQADPGDVVTWLAWALMEAKSGNVERARELFERGTEADPGNSVIWLAWALMEERLGNVERARELFERGTEADPGHAATWQAWALMEARLGEVERARELFRKGTEADPGDAAVWQAWALMETRLGDVERAWELTEADPGHAAVWQAWALMEARLGDVERARELFRKGTEADPGNA